MDGSASRRPSHSGIFSMASGALSVTPSVASNGTHSAAAASTNSANNAGTALQARHAAMAPGLWKAIRDINACLKAHETFRIVTHSRPDGDAIGSALGLYHHLTEQGKEVRVFTIGPLPPHFDFIPGYDKVSTQWDERWVPEITIYIDCGGMDRASDKDLRRGKATIVIDHHVGTARFGQYHYLDSAAAAAGEQVFHMIHEAGAPISSATAIALYVAIVSDTGNFRFSNAQAHVFDIATQLIQAGAVPADICTKLFESRPPIAVKLSGQVLSNLNYECDGQLCWGEITQPMYKAVGGEANEPDGLVGDLRAINNVMVAILIHEMANGGLRASLRSKDGVDVRAVAQECGGGGHINASGVMMSGPYEEAKDRLLTAARKAFAK